MDKVKSPGEIVQEILLLADNCSKLAERLNELEDMYAIWWSEKREEYKSDKSCEKAWDITTTGCEMRTIKSKIKTHDRKISAYKTYLRVLEGEARNQY
jgi:hypothetical protein